MPTRLPPAAPETKRSASAPSPSAELQQPPEAGGSSETESSPSAPAEASARHGYLPDPAPLSARRQWHYRIDYDRGAIRAESPRFECLPRPRASARRIGRYAFELWLGAELIERVRFDFPLLAAEEPPAGPRRPVREVPSFARGARVSTTLVVPHSERANRAHILDRATGDAVEVPWPPAAPEGADVAGCTEPALPQPKPAGDARR